MMPKGLTDTGRWPYRYAACLPLQFEVRPADALRSDGWNLGNTWV